MTPTSLPGHVTVNTAPIRFYVTSWWTTPSCFFFSKIRIIKAYRTNRSSDVTWQVYPQSTWQFGVAIGTFTIIQAKYKFKKRILVGLDFNNLTFFVWYDIFLPLFIIIIIDYFLFLFFGYVQKYYKSIYFVSWVNSMVTRIPVTSARWSNVEHGR